MRQTITTTPTALASLTDGTRYTIQNQAGRTLNVESATSAPTTAENAFVLDSGDFAVVRKASGLEVYIWNEDGTGGVVFDEAA